MEKKFSISKLLNNKLFKLAFVLLILMSAIGAMGASTYISYKKEKVKFEKALAKKAAKKHKKIVVKPFDKAHFQQVNLNERGFGRKNPFYPEQDNTHSLSNTSSADDYLIPPPLTGSQESDAALLMNTTVSGIMYDGKNPSAILNIEGTEYFVKNNDEINKYKILDISPNYVKVQYNKNIYKAGVGELLTELTSNSNIVNLGSKFGGNRRDSIPINIRKR